MAKSTDILSVLDSSERVALAGVARLGPWLAPLPPAYFVARATDRRLGTGQAWAWIIGAVVEAAGIAAASATLTAYTWNREKRVSDPKAPTGLGLVLCGVYLAVGVIISVVLELDGGLAVYVPGLFFALAGQVYAVKAMMSDQMRREQQARAAKIERSEARKEARREKLLLRDDRAGASAAGSAAGEAATAADFERAIVALSQASEDVFGAEGIAEAAGVGRTKGYELIAYGRRVGRLRQVGRGKYQYVNGKED
jgi:hypothetical protein